LLVSWSSLLTFSLRSLEGKERWKSYVQILNESKNSDFVLYWKIFNSDRYQNRLVWFFVKRNCVARHARYR
jgi:hypothetical protein